MNKKWFQLWNIGRLRGKILDILSLGRTMLLLAGGSLVFFMLLGAGGIAGQKMNPSPMPSMKGLAASLSSGFFMEILGMEVPHLPQGKGSEELSAKNVGSFVFQLLTSVNPGDPKSLLAREVPGMGADDPILLRKGSGGVAGAPADYHPGSDELGSEGGTEHDPPGTGGTEDPGTPVPTDPPQATPAPDHSGENTGAGKGEEGTTNGSEDTSVKRVLIYHSHPREAYNPLLGAQSDNPSSANPSKNVMLVGSYIAKRLEERGVGTLHSKDDYATKVKDYSWNFSYKYSRITVKAALAGNDQLTDLIDIHRDSQRHGKTTTEINGKNYAQVYFILGHENKNWKKNEAFANKIHQELEKNYPGLSRGIWGKTSSQGNGEYNQSLSPNSVLIEVGGIDSTDEELKRTADILGDIIADVYWSNQKADKVNAPETVGNPAADPGVTTTGKADSSKSKSAADKGQANKGS